MTTSTRITWIDWAKALLIMMMVMGHSGFGGVYLFHIPAFFIISGFLYRPHKWHKTIVSFFVPLVVFSLLNWFYKLGYNVCLVGERSFSVLFHAGVKYFCLVPFCSRGESFFQGDWFILTLLYLRLLFGDITGKSIPTKIVVIFTLLCTAIMAGVPYFSQGLINTPYRLWVYYILPCLPFFGFGILLKRIPDLMTLLLKRGTICLLIIVAIVLSPLVVPCDIYYNQYGPNYFLYFINSCAISLVFFFILQRLKPSVIITNVSKGTLLILGMHSLLLIPLRVVAESIIPGGLESCNQITHFFVFLLFAIVVISFCYPLILLCDKYCPILLGKQKSKAVN